MFVALKTSPRMAGGLEGGVFTKLQQLGTFYEENGDTTLIFSGLGPKMR